jgi:hypothetical protein
MPSWTWAISPIEARSGFFIRAQFKVTVSVAIGI